MNELIVIPAKNISFKEFLWGNRQNRTILTLAALAIAIQFVIFKYFYPYASFIHGDSFSYLEAANENLNINTYMIGYSRFLRFFSVFSTSDTILVAFQYVLISGSSLFLLFTIFFFFTLQKTTRYILLAFMIFNPLFLYLANLVSSDCLFASLSLLWFSLLVWIIRRPSNQILLWHGLILFLAFTVRYNALIYPILSIIAFGLSPLSMRKKLFGIGVAFLICGSFIFYTSFYYKKLTGVWQYSPFSGWQLANNAMYTYRYVDSAKRIEVPLKYKKLDKLIRNYFDATRDTSIFIIEKFQASTIYMWSPDLPLMTYRNWVFRNDTAAASELKRWASMAPLYKSYGLYIIRNYPWHFIRYFIWPNANKYYAPPVEFLESFNSGKDDVTQQAKEWFEYKSRIIKSRWRNPRIWLLNYYPILAGVVNVVMLFTLICYVSLKGWRSKNIPPSCLVLGFAVWLLNAAFTIGASSAALRFQTFPILLTTTFVALLLDWLWMASMVPSLENPEYKLQSKIQPTS